MNPKDSNVYREAKLQLSYDFFGVAWKHERSFSINIQSHSGLASQHKYKSITSCLFFIPKLVKVKELLESQDYTVSQVLYEIGISSHSYFTKVFKERFGVFPSDLIHRG